mgnify:CR=1 FL=1
MGVTDLDLPDVLHDDETLGVGDLGAERREQGRLAGIISIGDVVKHRLHEMEHEQSALREYIQTA